MRVFPMVGITAPRLPFEKSYSFFIVPSLFGIGLPHRDDPHVLAAGRVNHNHQRPEDIHSDGHESSLTLRGLVFDSERERIVEHPVALRQGHAVLLEICRILLRIEFGGHAASICTLCIYVKRARAAARAADGPMKLPRSIRVIERGWLSANNTPARRHVYSTVSCELLAHDLAHELLRHRLLAEPDVGFEGLVDQSLVAFSGLLGLGLESLEYRVVEVDRDAGFPDGRDYRATLALREVIQLFHSSFALWDRPSAQR